MRQKLINRIMVGLAWGMALLLNERGLTHTGGYLMKAARELAALNNDKPPDTTQR